LCDLAVLARNPNTSKAMREGVATTIGAAGQECGLEVRAAVDSSRSRVHVKDRDAGAAGS
jgi:hypothetical protein